MSENQRTRSPRYPSIALSEAVKMARRIFNEDGMNAVDRESAVKHIGYTTLNGASATALASLKQYGLTSDAGKGMLRLTALALDLLEPESESAHAQAVQAAAFSPDLFAALRERFPEKVPSESNLRAHLLRQGFTNAAVKAVVPAYRETCEYAASADESESHGLPEERVPESLESRREEVRQMTFNTPPSPSEHTEQPNAPGRRMVFDTEEGEVVFTYPSHLSEESVEDLEEWFALVAKRLRRATKH